MLRFPAWDCLPYDRLSPAAEISATRMATLTALAHGFTGAFVLLTTLSALTQKLPPRATLRGAGFSARLNQRIDEDALRQFLVRMGFTQTPTVMEPGDWSPRGGIIDIWPPGQSAPVRLDMFGDTLDGLRRFDPATQRTTDQLQLIELAPVSEVILDGPAITRFRQTYRIEFGAAGTDDPLYESVTAGRKPQGAEHWLPFFHETLETLAGLPARVRISCSTTAPSGITPSAGRRSRTCTTTAPRQCARRAGSTASTSRPDPKRSTSCRPSWRRCSPPTARSTSLRSGRLPAPA